MSCNLIYLTVVLKNKYTLLNPINNLQYNINGEVLWKQSSHNHTNAKIGLCFGIVMIVKITNNILFHWI